MTWLLALAARPPRRASRTVGEFLSRYPLWAALALFLVACGQAVAAAPVPTATIIAGVYPMPAGSATLPPADTPSLPAPTVLPSNPPATVAPRQTSQSVAPGPTASATRLPTTTPTA